MKKLLLFIGVVFSFTSSRAQITINSYAKVTDIPSCNPCIGNCDRLIVDDASPFNIGDVIMIIQVKGAAVNLTADTTFGDVLTYGATGFHEKNQINNIIANTIYLNSGLAGNYDPTQSLQIVSVPQFPAGYVVPAAGLTCPDWDGNTGGVIALDVVGTLDLQGDIDARGKGLRGGQNPNSNFNEVFCGMKGLGDWHFDAAHLQVAGRKGEGIAEWILPTYELGRGKWANGGGGGHNHNAGGGGGSNMGYGGLGGHEYGNLGCGSVQWIRNGIGGQVLDHQGGLRMFMGGGGGAGQENNNVGNSGGDGGGIIIISADQIDGNGNWIRADGNKGINYMGIQDAPGRNDGGGGGGAGGSIKIQCNNFGATNLTLSAEGADGGDLNTTIHGPGGGGGGGLICSSIPAFPGNVTVDVTGGQGGFTLNNGSNWGSQPGGNGQVDAACSPPVVPPLQFDVSIGSDVNLCAPPNHIFDTRLDSSNTFIWYFNGVPIPGAIYPQYNVTAAGTYIVEASGPGCPSAFDTVVVTSDAAVPIDSTFCGTNVNVGLGITGPGKYAWYDAMVGGTKLGTGDSFITPPISATTTYYVEDTSVFTYTVGEPTSGHGLSGGWGESGVNPDRLYLQFDALNDFTLDAITIGFKAWWLSAGHNFGATVEIYDDMGVLIASHTDNSLPAGISGNVPSPNIVYVRMPLGLNVPMGSNYSLRVTPNGGEQIHWFENGRNLMYTDPMSQVLSIWGTHANYMPVINPDGSVTNPFWGAQSHPAIFDWEVSSGIPCGRVPVTANYFCLTACNDPVSASISPSNPPAQCGGNVLLTASATGAPPAGGFHFQFFADTGTGAFSVQAASATNTYNATYSGSFYVVVTDPADAATCNVQSATVSVAIDQNPTTALLGTDFNLCGSDTILAANSPSIGTGVWTQTAGSGASFTPNANDPNASVTGMSTGLNTFRWTISNGSCPDSFDEINITSAAPPSAAAVGPVSIDICGDSLRLGANTPAVGIGTWSVIAGSGSFSNVNDPASDVSGLLTPGANTLRWTISNLGCPDETDDIVINTHDSASQAIAGPVSPILTCSDTVIMAATAPVSGTGSWSVVIPGVATIDNSSDPTTMVSGLAIGQTTMRWTVSTPGICPDNTDDIIIDKTAVAAASVSIDPGSPAPVCAGANFTFKALPTNGGAATYEWIFNGVSQGVMMPDSFEVVAPNNDDSIRVIMTSSLACAIGSPASSSVVTISIDNPPSGSVPGPNDTVCTDNYTLNANNPVTGIGTWSISSGSGAFSSSTDPAATVTNLGIGDNVFIWTINNGVCPDEVDSLTITRIGTLTSANAGPDQTGTLCEDNPTTILDGNSPLLPGETGLWTVTQGTGTVPSPGDSNSAVNNLSNGLNELVWSISNGVCPLSTDTVRIMVDSLPTAAAAGPDQPTCATSVFLAGNNPIVGTGIWTIVSEPFATSTVVTQGDSASQITGIDSAGTFTYRWTISNGTCPVSSDDVDINKSGTITTANAGSDINICESTSSQLLDGNAVNAGNGETGGWAIISGPAGATLNDTTLEDPAISSLVTGSYVLRRRIQNGLCPPSDDFLNLDVDAQPTTALAGVDSTVCGTSIQLFGNAPVTGTGTWTIVAGTGTFTNANDPNTNMTGLTSPGIQICDWCISTGGVCPQSCDQIQITSSGIVVPDVTLSVNSNPVCFGSPQNFTTTESNGGTPAYQWYIDDVLQAGTNPAFNPAVLLNGQEVKVVMNSSLPCAIPGSDADSMTVTVVNPPTPIITGGPASICSNQSTTLTAFGSGGTFTWMDSITGAVVGNGNSYVATSTGTYYVVESNGVCPDGNSASTQITVTQQPIADAGPNLEVFVDESIILQGSVTIGSISWSPALNLSNPTIATPTLTPDMSQAGWNTYTLTATIGSCVDTSSVMILVRTPIVIPNAFTPNADGNNDEWIITGLQGYPDAILTVYNRWGSMVYKSIGNIEWWNGYRNGEPMPIATYYYILDLGDGTKPLAGSVTIVR